METTIFSKMSFNCCSLSHLATVLLLSHGVFDLVRSFLLCICFAFIVIRILISVFTLTMSKRKEKKMKSSSFIDKFEQSLISLY